MQEVVKKGDSTIKVYYIIPLNYRLSGNPEKVELYYFREKHTEVNVSVSFMFLAK